MSESNASSDYSKTHGDKEGSERTRERDIGINAQAEYESGNYAECLKCLDSLSESKALEYNRLIAQFAVDKHVDKLLGGLLTSEDLDLDQQVLVDYNRALALAKYRERFDEAIDLLENRMSVLSESASLVDERLAMKVYLLLAILYMERRKDPLKALPLLQYISEKCDVSCHPPRLQQLKAKCFLQLGSHKNAKRELKAISGEPLIRSYLELQRNNHRKALKIFSSCTEETALYKNNDALIHYGLGKKNTAVFCMTKAVAKTPCPEMLYNLAILHLFTGNTKNAFDILYNLIPSFKSNPRIWFRLADCCLEERNRNNEIETQRLKCDLIRAPDTFRRKLLTISQNEDEESLVFARGCLMNALTVMNSSTCNFYPSNAPSENEMIKLKIALFLNLAYTNLILNDYSPAYTFAKSALSLQPKGHQKALANLYAGESLLFLDKISEAISHFSPSHAAEETVAVEEGAPTPPPQNPCSWFPHTARVVLTFNQAVAYCLKGDMDKASDTLRQIPQHVTSPDTLVPVQVVSLATYIHLHQGHVDSAKSLLKNLLPLFR